VLVPQIQQFLTVFKIGSNLARFWRAFGIGGGSSPPRLDAPLHLSSHHVLFKKTADDTMPMNKRRITQFFCENSTSYFWRHRYFLFLENVSRFHICQFLSSRLLLLITKTDIYTMLEMVRVKVVSGVKLCRVLRLMLHSS